MIPVITSYLAAYFTRFKQCKSICKQTPESGDITHQKSIIHHSTYDSNQHEWSYVCCIYSSNPVRQAVVAMINVAVGSVNKQVRCATRGRWRRWRPTRQLAVSTSRRPCQLWSHSSLTTPQRRRRGNDRPTSLVGTYSPYQLFTRQQNELVPSSGFWVNILHWQVGGSQTIGPETALKRCFKMSH